MAKAANSDVHPRVDRDRADERHGDGRDVVGLLDLPGGHERHDGQPDELLAGPDPLPGPGVEVVVEGAQRADAGQRRERREGRGVRARAQEEVDAEDDDDDEQAAHRRRPFLDVVALRTVLADALAEPERVEQPDVRRHQDDHEGEGEEQALDQLDGHRAAAAARRARGRRRPSTSRSRPIPRDALTRTTSPSRRRGGERVEGGLGVGDAGRSAAGRGRPRRAPSAMPAAPRADDDQPVDACGRGLADRAVAVVAAPRPARASRRGPRPRRPGSPASRSSAATTEPRRGVVRVVDRRVTAAEPDELRPGAAPTSRPRARSRSRRATARRPGRRRRRPARCGPTAGRASGSLTGRRRPSARRLKRIPSSPAESTSSAPTSASSANP